MTTEELLQRPYDPPKLFIFEEVEVGGGYHTLHIAHATESRDWSEPYKKSGTAEYRSRIVEVLFPPLDVLKALAEENKGLKAENLALKREVNRWIAGEPVEGDYAPYDV